MSKVIKVLLLGLTFFFLYHEIFKKHNLPELWQQYSVSFKSQPFLYLFLFLLMIANWSLETRKWMFLLGKDHSLPFLKSIRAVFTGVAISLFTPNRVGEFGGRMLYFDDNKKVDAVSATIAGSLAQFTITIIVGVIGCAWYLYFGSNPNFQFGWLGFILAFLVVGISLYAYFKIKKISWWLESRNWHKIFKKTFKTLGSYTVDELFVNLWLSLIRYFIFTLQMVLVIYLLVDFSGEFNWLFVLFSIITYFFIQTAIPTVALSEIGVRGMILSFLFFEVQDTSQLVLAGSLLWFINIIIPALFGAFFILGTKISSRLG